MTPKTKYILVMAMVSAAAGCVSSIRQGNLAHDLPSELPKEMKDKFAVKELLGNESSVGPQRLAEVAETDLETSKFRKHRKKRRTHGSQEGRELAQVPVIPFVYPKRRPEKDPIWVGEKFVYSITYFGVAAGTLTVDVLPFKILGKRKSYHFRGNAVSSAVFSMIYRLDDVVESFMDYESSFSHLFHLVQDESKQTRDDLELNDLEKKETFYWNRWHPKDAPYRETKETGPIEPFSQDSLSALFYLRTVPLETGSVVTFPVASEGKNWEAICNVLRRETMSTPLGTVSTVVIQPDTKFQGVLKKNGNSFLWLTDDERRFPIRLEAKVRIGTVVAALKKIEIGTPPPSKTP